VDFSKEVTVRGTVTSYNWGNPHIRHGRRGRQRQGGEVERRRSEHEPDGGQRPKSVAEARRCHHRDGLSVHQCQKILRLQKIVMANGKEMFLYGRSAFPSLFFTLSSERRYSYLRALSLIRA